MTSSFEVPYTDFPAQNAGVREELRGAFDEVLDSGHYIQGPNVAAFEREFADFCEAPYATGAANGTCSLHLVLRSMGVGPGDEVITAPNSFFASAAAISLVGAKIVFADVNEDSNIDPDAIEAAITDRTRAITITCIAHSVDECRQNLATPSAFDATSLSTSICSFEIELVGNSA